MESDETIVRKLRLRQCMGVAAVLGIFGMQFWRAHIHSHAQRIAIDVFVVLAALAICLYVVRVIIPLEKLRRSRSD